MRPNGDGWNAGRTVERAENGVKWLTDKARFGMESG